MLRHQHQHSITDHCIIILLSRHQMDLVVYLGPSLLYTYSTAMHRFLSATLASFAIGR
jgi:hypothetical protein